MKQQKVRLGRPRSQETDQAILETALRLVSAKGFRAVTVDQIAAKAGVGKMTVYRRYPNKSTLVMHALLTLVGPQTEFPIAGRALYNLRQQLSRQAEFFCSKYGRLIRSLLAEAQSDDELSRAFRDGWILPRRWGVLATLQSALEEGDLRKDINFEVAVDVLYGPFYYRLLLGTGALDNAFINDLYKQFLIGHRRQRSSDRTVLHESGS